jgi:hypothetical protein
MLPDLHGLIDRHPMWGQAHKGGKISWGMKFLPANPPPPPGFLVRKYCYHRALYRFKFTARFAL